MDKHVLVMITDNEGLLLSKTLVKVGEHEHSPGKTVVDAANTIEELIVSRYESEEVD
jgi:hypothetical protein